MSESIAVLRILVSGGLATLWPWLILTISFGMNLAFFAAAQDNPDITHQSAGILSLFLTAIFANLQSWTQVLPFTVGLSGTRRGFMGGMGLFILAQSVMAGVILTVLAAVEGATGGWGFQMRFFRTALLDSLTVPGQFVVLAGLFLAVSALGTVAGAVLVRWGSIGMWALGVLAIVLVGAVLVLVAFKDGWGSLATAVAGRSWWEIWGLVPLAVTTFCGGVAYLVIRRAPVR